MEAIVGSSVTSDRFQHASQIVPLTRPRGSRSLRFTLRTPDVINIAQDSRHKRHVFGELCVYCAMDVRCKLCS